MKKRICRPLESRDRAQRTWLWTASGVDPPCPGARDGTAVGGGIWYGDFERGVAGNQCYHHSRHMLDQFQLPQMVIITYRGPEY